MKFILIATLFFFLSVNYAIGQQPAVKGAVNIIQDERVNELIEKYIESNKTFDGHSGYRIQIFFDSGSNSRSRANNERRKFLSLYPEMETYITFDAPNFKVRVGDFRTRIEAEKALRDIRNHFEMAYVVPSKIALPEL